MHVLVVPRVAGGAREGHGAVLPAGADHLQSFRARRAVFGRNKRNKVARSGGGERLEWVVVVLFSAFFVLVLVLEVVFLCVGDGFLPVPGKKTRVWA